MPELIGAILDCIDEPEFPPLAKIAYLDFIEEVAKSRHAVLAQFVEAILPRIARNFVDCEDGVIAFARAAFWRIVSVFKSDELTRFVLTMSGDWIASEDWQARLCGVWVIAVAVETFPDGYLEEAIEQISVAIRDSVAQCRAAALKAITAVCADRAQEAFFAMILECFRSEMNPVFVVCVEGALGPLLGLSAWGARALLRRRDRVFGVGERPRSVRFGCELHSLNCGGGRLSLCAVLRDGPAVPRAPASVG
jgi:hypothetical protein